jgi:predicted permease
LANLISVWMLARHGELALWREVARNPLIWATATGFVLNLLDWLPPAPAQAFLARLADASIALGLLAVGAALRLRGEVAVRPAALYLTVVKLVALPCSAALIGQLVGLTGVYFATAVLFAALPTASSAYILAMRMGGDGRSVAWIISATTLASMLTLPVWVAWLSRLG